MSQRSDRRRARFAGIIRGRLAGFTLVELLVVVGLIALLIAILLPALGRARQQANAIKCRANMADIGKQLLIYSNSNNGWLFPNEYGADHIEQQRWPVYVLTPNQWNT